MPRIFCLPRLLQHKRSLPKDKNIAPSYMAMLRSMYQSADNAVARVLVVKNKNEDVREILKTAIKRAATVNTTRRSKAALFDFLRGTSQATLNQGEMVAVNRAMMTQGHVYLRVSFRASSGLPS